MPQRCTVCAHPARQAVDAALMAGQSIRAVAKQFDLTPAAVHRHSNHDAHARARASVGQVEHIDAQIRKLKAAESRAKRKRDDAAALSISKELRNWFILRTRAEVAMAAVATTSAPIAELTRAEACALAQAVIEQELASGSRDARAWLYGLVERENATTETRATVNLPDAQENDLASSEENES